MDTCVCDVVAAAPSTNSWATLYEASTADESSSSSSSNSPVAVGGGGGGRAVSHRVVQDAFGQLDQMLTQLDRSNAGIKKCAVFFLHRCAFRFLKSCILPPLLIAPDSTIINIDGRSTLSSSTNASPPPAAMSSVFPYMALSSPSSAASSRLLAQPYSVSPAAAAGVALPEFTERERRLVEKERLLELREHHLSQKRQEMSMWISQERGLVTRRAIICPFYVFFLLSLFRYAVIACRPFRACLP